MSGTPSILAIDQGTTGTTCLVISEDGRVLGRAYSEFTQYFPQPGWVEHDALEIWDVTQAVAREALAAAAEGVRWVATFEQNAGQMIDDVRLGVLGRAPGFARGLDCVSCKWPEPHEQRNSRLRRVLSELRVQRNFAIAELQHVSLDPERASSLAHREQALESRPR